MSWSEGFSLGEGIMNTKGCKEHREFCRIADEKVKGLEQQLKEERKKVVQETKELVVKATCYDTEEEVRNHLYDMSASEVLEILDQVEKGGNNGNEITEAEREKQNQTAIAELEKVKVIFSKNYRESNSLIELWDKFWDDFEQQIKSLKGE